MTRKGLPAGRIAIYVWAAALAMLVNTPAGPTLAWRHPYCDAQADGPAYYAWGLPLPYAQPTGVSSHEFTYMPHVLAVNLVLVGLAAFALLRLVFRRRTPGRGALISGLAVCIAIGGLLVVVELFFLGHPRRSIAGPHDSYWSYRPSAFVSSAGHKPCTGIY